MKKLLRTFQTYFPFAAELKAEAQSGLRATFRIPSEDTYRLFERFPFPEGQVFVDAGANRGQSVAAFRLYQAAVPVHCFEPNPLLAAKLARRRRGDANVTVHALGLGDETGVFDLYVPSYRNFRFDGLASLDRGWAAEWLCKDTIFNFDPSKVGVESLHCRVVRLDDLRLEPALIKIDVQGSETAVLRGALETISRTRPAFIIENDDVGMKPAALLRSLDYQMAEFRDGRFYLNRMGYRNSVYLPAERVGAITAAYE